MATDSYDSSLGKDVYGAAPAGNGTVQNAGGNIGAIGSVSGGSDTIGGFIAAAKIGPPPCKSGATGFSGAPVTTNPKLVVPTPVLPPQPTPINPYKINGNVKLAPDDDGNLTSGGTNQHRHSLRECLQFQ